MKINSFTLMILIYFFYLSNFKKSFIWSVRYFLNEFFKRIFQFFNKKVKINKQIIMCDKEVRLHIPTKYLQKSE